MKKVIFIFFIFLFLPFLQSYSQRQEILKEQARSYRTQGYRLQSSGNLRQALSFYQKAVEIDPFYTEAYNDIGVIYEEQGHLDKAKSYYQKALDLSPSYLAAYTNLALLYERAGDVENAAKYWKERYIRGRPGEYWREVARHHLLRIGTYPEIRKEIMEQEAARLSRELAYKREQQRLEAIEEAKLHFNLGRRDLEKGAYPSAIKNLNTVLDINPSDSELLAKTKELLMKAENLRTRQVVLDALRNIESGQYLMAAEDLKEALSAVGNMSRGSFFLEKR